MKVAPTDDSAPAYAIPAVQGGGYSSKARHPNCISCETHSVSLDDTQIELKRSIPFNRKTTNLNTQDVSLLRVTHNNLAVATLVGEIVPIFVAAIGIIVAGIVMDQTVQTACKACNTAAGFTSGAGAAKCACSSGYVSPPRHACARHWPHIIARTPLTHTPPPPPPSAPHDQRSPSLDSALSS